MIGTVLLDIDDTLFPSTEFSSLARRNALSAFISMGYCGDLPSLEERLKRIIESKGSNYERHFDDLCKELSLDEPSRYVAAAVAAYHDTKASIAPFPQVPLVLMRLREKGIRLYAATNGNAVKQWDKLIRLGLAHVFDGMFVSETMGMLKGEGFYARILSQLRVEAGSCLMVGDREDADIAPAKALGIRTVRVLSERRAAEPSRADSVVKDLSSLPAIVESL